RALAAVIAWTAAGTVVLAGSAKADTRPEATTPCAGTLWGACALQSAPGGYRYRYSYKDGMVAPVPVPSDSAAALCDVNCPADPAAVCDLLTLVGPDPMMSTAERTAYDHTVSGCGNYLLADDPIPLSQVQTALASTMRSQLLPKPSITVTVQNPRLAGPSYLMHATGPTDFSGNTAETSQPLAATIHASPQYHWDFGDGTTQEASNMTATTRGWDAAGVAHRYGRSGSFRVTLTVTWTGTFALSGVREPLPLQPVRLTATTEVVVGSLDTIGAPPG
ncbi:PKD domain-containing protein, partial [Frankia sp. KB5]|uniref:PKD domain-containing protein n=2 Tax=unclassified Frankia TaxID=2632575 RepID=UPI000A12271A